ncbi:MAG TPA: VTT domain-containing protein, partial [Gemmatimonadales bacterium]|nr:VTT domain-containing protein [Gemmatimonadales bacterium]
EGVLGWLASLPSAAIYVVLAALAFTENLLPVVPADVAAALGAFLTHRGATAAVPVFLVVWLSNVAGAIAVYFFARRVGRPFFATGLGRRLLSPTALLTIERDYLRWGVAGILIARFLPGIRAVVPPFAGIFGLPPWRALPPLVVASGVWYGAIVALGVYLGGEWTAIERALGQVNRALGLVALLAVAVVVVVVIARRRRRPEEPLLEAMLDVLRGGRGPELAPIDPRQAARLLLEFAYAEEGLTAAQREDVARHLRQRWRLDVPAEEATPPRAPGRLAAVGARLRERFEAGRRLRLVEEMWHAAFADGELAGEEPWLMQRAGESLGFTPEEVERIRERLRAARGPA